MHIGQRSGIIFHVGCMEYGVGLALRSERVRKKVVFRSCRMLQVIRSMAQSVEVIRLAANVSYCKMLEGIPCTLPPTTSRLKIQYPIGGTETIPLSRNAFATDLAQPALPN